MDVVHLVWPVGPQLTRMELLNLRLWLRHGVVPHLWSYDHSQTADAPAEVVRREARDVLPASSLFRFNSERGFAAGAGKGSLAHWSDQFQLAMLHREGGWYAQMDVSCLRRPDPTPETYFAPLAATVMQACVMATPPGQAWTAAALAELQRTHHAGTAGSIGWFDSMACISRHVHEAGLAGFIGAGATLEDDVAPRYMLGTERPVEGVHFLHWSNAGHGRHKTNPLPDTFYRELLAGEGLT